MEDGDRPLSNEDFRRLLATPRPGQTPRMGVREEKKKKPKVHKPKPAGKDGAEDDAGYRRACRARLHGIAGWDRRRASLTAPRCAPSAQGPRRRAPQGPERRSRGHPERPGRPARRHHGKAGRPPSHPPRTPLLAGALGRRRPAACGVPPRPKPPPNRRPQGADLSRVTYEESKYLGGDVAHTHLVKGLDFALLQKARTPCSPCAPARRAARQAPAPFCPRASGRALCSAAAPWCDVAPA